LLIDAYNNNLFWQRLSFTSPTIQRPQIRTVTDPTATDASNDEKSDSQEEKKAENWKQRTWRTAKRVAKWQILRYIVQILLCLLLVSTSYYYSKRCG